MPPFKSKVRAGLATLEQERAKQRLDEAAAFLEENKRHNAIMQAAASSALKNVGAVRTESERAVLDMTAPFWCALLALGMFQCRGYCFNL